MKRYNLYIITLIFGLFFLNACQDENLVKKTGEVEEGIPVDVKLSFESFDLEEVKTKADLGTDAENAVNDIYLFIFNRDKKLEHGDLYTIPSTQDKTITLNQTITSGKKYIIAIANPSSDNLVLQDYKNIESLEDLEKIQLELNGDLIQRPSSKGFVMSGYWGTSVSDAKLNKGLCSIPPSVSTSGNTVTISGGKIYFTHLDAKIKFDVQLANPTNKEFIPKDWKVVNVPRASFLLPNAEDAAQNEETDLFSTSAAKFEELTLDDNHHYQGGKFTFYMMENRKSALNEISEYSERERQEKDEAGLNGAFLNANPLSTYVVLSGTYYEYKDNGEIKMSAEVRYTIHLGYVNKVASDFKSERNIFYTYHIKIDGVQAIIDEVETSQAGVPKDVNEAQPGAEGDVITSDQNLLLDAHYEVQKITFYKDKLTSLSVAVKTPYEARTSADLNSGYYEISEDGTEKGELKDYKWVEFARNNNASTDFRSYKDAYQLTASNPTSPNRLISVKDLLNTLYEKKQEKTIDTNFWTAFKENGTTRYKVVYTVFINEYYYDKDPITGGETSWKTFVNWENRQMHILCDTKFSFDKQSSLTNSNIMISQRSIKTIYNKDANGLNTAWGIETVSEDGRIPTNDVTPYQDKDWKWRESYKYRTETKTNGRYNTLMWYRDASSKAWDTYVDFKTNVNKKVVKAQYACFQRNRDLNGDGRITPNEIRWYLPATNQYVGLWIGQDALPSEARLLQKTVNKVTVTNCYENHFISSNNVRFWTEEGVSTGSEDASSNLFNVRCARNLGYKYDNKNETVPDESNYTYMEPDDYVQKILSGGIVTEIDLSRVAPVALRESEFQSLTFHPEHTSGSLNHPYEKFSVSNIVVGGVNNINKTLPDCSKAGAGFRVPNQRELALLVGYSTENLAGLGSCTYSELTYKAIDKKLYTVHWNGSGMFNFLTLSESSSTKTRCVKDGKK
ncbi:fimbrial protein [Parabacteroides sp. APC149_11_2_Y6]